MGYVMLISGTGKVLAEKLGRKKAKEIMSRAQRRLEELKRENAGDSKALRSHTFSRIYPGIAMYETLQAEGMDKDKALWYIHEYYQRFSRKIAGIIQATCRIPGFAERIPKIFETVAVKGFPETAGFCYEKVCVPADTTGFNIVRCPCFETCRKYGCPELTAVFCDADDAGYGNMHPSLIWGRTSTLGHGAPCCDFRLTYKEK